VLEFQVLRGQGEYQVVQAIGVCCYSNTGSADLLLQQQLATVRTMGEVPADTGGE
jgi:hypothetical protein